MRPRHNTHTHTHRVGGFQEKSCNDETLAVRAPVVATTVWEDNLWRARLRRAVRAHLCACWPNERRGGEALFVVARLSSISSLFQSASERVGPSNYTEPPSSTPTPATLSLSLDAQQDGIAASRHLPATLYESRWTFVSLIVTETDRETMVLY